MIAKPAKGKRKTAQNFCAGWCCNTVELQGMCLFDFGNDVLADIAGSVHGLCADMRADDELVALEQRGIETCAGSQAASGGRADDGGFCPSFCG